MIGYCMFADEGADGLATSLTRYSQCFIGSLEQGEELFLKTWTSFQDWPEILTRDKEQVLMQLACISMSRTRWDAGASQHNQEEPFLMSSPNYFAYWSHLSRVIGAELRLRQQRVCLTLEVLYSGKDVESIPGLGKRSV